MSTRLLLGLAITLAWSGLARADTPQASSIWYSPCKKAADCDSAHRCVSPGWCVPKGGGLPGGEVHRVARALFTGTRKFVLGGGGDGVVTFRSGVGPKVPDNFEATDMFRYAVMELGGPPGKEIILHVIHSMGASGAESFYLILDSRGTQLARIVEPDFTPQIQGFDYADGVVTVHYMGYGPKDVHCCPSVPGVARFVLGGLHPAPGETEVTCDPQGTSCSITPR